MNLLAAGLRVLIRPYVTLGRAVAQSKPAQWVAEQLIRAPLKTLGVFWKLTTGWPGQISRFVKEAEKKGDELCYGKLAPLTIAPGIMLRTGAGLAYACRNTIGLVSAVGGLPAAGLVAAGLCSPLALATLPGFLVLTAALYAPSRFAVYAGGMAGMAAVGAALNSLPAVWSIATGFKRRREAFNNEENERRNAGAISYEEVQKLPPLDAAAYYRRYEMSTSQPHERVAWFEDLKAKFPEDFAEAARLRPDELSPVLAQNVQLGKPLRFKEKPAPRKPWSLGRLLGR